MLAISCTNWGILMILQSQLDMSPCRQGTVFLIIPVVGFLRLLVHNSLLLDPVLGLLVLGVLGKCTMYCNEFENQK